jgi:hypothetical protein
MRLDVPVTRKITAIAGEEPFFGVIEDAEAPPHPLGFWEQGFRMNRIYAGFSVRPVKRLSISPQYVYETTYDSEGHVSATNHYFFLTIAYVLQVTK